MVVSAPFRIDDGLRTVLNIPMNKLAVFVFVFMLVVGCSGLSPAVEAGKLAQDKNYPVTFTDGQASISVKPIPEDRAVQRAVAEGLLAMPDYKGIEGSVDWPISWHVFARQQDMDWHVFVSTQKVIPSYSCHMIVTEDLEVSSKQPCRWNK